MASNTVESLFGEGVRVVASDSFIISSVDFNNLIIRFTVRLYSTQNDVDLNPFVDLEKDKDAVVPPGGEVRVDVGSVIIIFNNFIVTVSMSLVSLYSLISATLI